MVDFGLFFRDIDKIQDIMDDVAEQLQVSNEMSDLISSPIGNGEQFHVILIEISQNKWLNWACSRFQNANDHNIQCAFFMFYLV